MRKKLTFFCERAEVEKQRTTLQLPFLVMKGKQILIEFALTLCGLIKDKDDSLVFTQVRHFDPKTMFFFREERMFKLVNQDFLSNAKNFFQHFETFFVKLAAMQVANAVEEELFQDLAKSLVQK